MEEIQLSGRYTCPETKERWVIGLNKKNFGVINDKIVVFIHCECGFYHFLSLKEKNNPDISPEME